MDRVMEGRIRKLCCQGCGATLPVAEGIRFVSCNYCDARLEIVEDAATTHTRLLDEIDRRTRKIEEVVDKLQLQRELERLEKSWDKYEAQVNPKDAKGRSTNSSGSLILFGGLGAIVGAALLFSELWWIGLVILPASLWFIWGSIKFEMRAGQLHQACRLKYEMRRRQILQQLNRVS